MRNYRAAVLTWLTFLISINILAQDSIPSIPPRFYNTISKKSSQLQEQLDKKSTRALQKYQKYKAGILKKLSRVDSTAAKNFSIVSDQRYKELQDRLAVEHGMYHYIPALDTISSSLKFLNQNSWLGQDTKDIAKAIGSVKGLTHKIQKGEDFKDYLKGETVYIKEQLQRFGLTKELKRINKNLYYFSEELFEIKESLKDGNKIERKVISLLGQTNVFQKFIQKNGMLAGIFSGNGQESNVEAIGSLTGLQTRAEFNQLVQNQIAAGGPNAQNVIRENIQQGQEQLQQLKNKLTGFGIRGSEDIMPEGFTPNSQKTKSFLERIELYPNVQSAKANNYFPATTNFGLGIGYRLSGAVIIGLGAAYKMGLGQNIQHIKLTHQGIGLRSYFDWKFPTKFFGLKKAGSWWITGGYERNYNSVIKKVDELKNYSAWQASGLIGISKSFSFTSKFVKGTKLQLLWDFLSYQQIPRTNPITFRVGYNIQ